MKLELVERVPTSVVDHRRPFFEASEVLVRLWEEAERAAAPPVPAPPARSLKPEPAPTPATVRYAYD